jgi:hypothetical protein
MLDELRPRLSAKTVRNLLNDTKRPEQLLGAEMELGLLWGRAQTAQLEVEPEIPNSSRVPEAYSADFLGAPSYIEVTTISDGKLSGEADMQRAAQKMVEFANSVRRKSGKNLYFSFVERNYWEGSRYFREHHIASDFELTDAMKADMRAWLDAPDHAKTSLHLLAPSINVTVTSREHPQRMGFNYFSSLPSLAYDIENNRCTRSLRRRRSSLRAFPRRP